MRRIENPTRRAGRRARRLSTLTALLALLAAASAGPAEAETYERSFAKPWTGSGNGASKRLITSTAVSAANAGTGSLTLKTECVARDTARAQANIHFDFKYDAVEAHPVIFRAKGHAHGVLHKDLGGITNDMTLQVLLWQYVNGHFVPTAGTASFVEHNVTATVDRDYELAFTWNLVPGDSLRVMMLLTGAAYGETAGHADVLFNNGYEVTWDTLELEFVPSVTTSGGTQSGQQAVQEHDVPNNSYDLADSLSFRTGNNSVNINGWRIFMSRFDEAASQRPGGSPRDVDAVAWGENVARGKVSHIQVTHWLDSTTHVCANTMNVGGFTWYPAAKALADKAAEAFPDHGWEFAWPHPRAGGAWGHTFGFLNGEAAPRALRLGSLCAIASPDSCLPSQAPFVDVALFASFDPASGPPPMLESLPAAIDAVLPAVTAPPLVVTVETPGNWDGGWIYLKYSLLDDTGTQVLANFWGGHEVLASPTTGVGGGAEPPPAGAGRLSIHPNPFNPATTIEYDLPREGAVRLAIHDVAGRRVATLVDEVQTAGRHAATWNTAGGGHPLASGVYLCVLQTRDGRTVKPLVVVK